MTEQDIAPISVFEAIGRAVFTVAAYLLVIFAVAPLLRHYGW